MTPSEGPPPAVRSVLLQDELLGSLVPPHGRALFIRRGVLRGRAKQRPPVGSGHVHAGPVPTWDLRHPIRQCLRSVAAALALWPVTAADSSAVPLGQAARPVLGYVLDPLQEVTEFGVIDDLQRRLHTAGLDGDQRRVEATGGFERDGDLRQPVIGGVRGAVPSRLGSRLGIRSGVRSRGGGVLWSVRKRVVQRLNLPHQ